MKAIFSFTEPLSQKTFVSIEHYRIYTAMVNYYIQKQGLETIFFGDDISIQNFQNIKFDFIEKMPTNFLKDLPKCFWSGGKLAALYTMNEPCVHIDDDLFLTKPLPQDFLKNDIVCYNEELFANKNMERLQNIFKIQPSETIGKETISHNCAILGGQDINTVKNSIKILFDFVSNNASHIDKTYIKYRFIEKIDLCFVPSVLMEQIWLFQIFKSFGKQIHKLIHVNNYGEDFIQKSNQFGCVHLMHQKKFFKEPIQKLLLKKNISY